MREKANNDTRGRSTEQLPQKAGTTGPELPSPKTRLAGGQHPHVALISLAFHQIWHSHCGGKSDKGSRAASLVPDRRRPVVDMTRLAGIGTIASRMPSR